MGSGSTTTVLPIFPTNKISKFELNSIYFVFWIANIHFDYIRMKGDFMKLEEAFSLIHLLHSANTATKKAFLSYGSLKKIQKGEHVFLDHSQMEFLYFVVDGIAALYKVNHQQDKKVIFICGRGELLNETVIQNQCTAIYCEMLSDGVILAFPVKLFLELMKQDSVLLEAVMMCMTKRICRLYHQLQNTSNTVFLEKQIAAKLWKLARDHGVFCEEGVEINFDLSISYLADLVGSKRETVSRHVKALKKKELICVRNNRFIVKNQEELAKFFRES